MRIFLVVFLVFSVALTAGPIHIGKSSEAGSEACYTVYPYPPGGLYGTGCHGPEIKTASWAYNGQALEITLRAAYDPANWPGPVHDTESPFPNLEGLFRSEDTMTPFTFTLRTPVPLGPTESYSWHFDILEWSGPWHDLITSDQPAWDSQTWTKTVRLGASTGGWGGIANNGYLKFRVTVHTWDWGGGPWRPKYLPVHLVGAEPAAVPEPGAWQLAGLGGVALAGWRLRRRR